MSGKVRDQARKLCEQAILAIVTFVGAGKKIRI